MIEVKSSFGLELERFSKDREECILLVGSKDDIRGYAKDNDIKLTEDQIDDIMNDNEPRPPEDWDQNCLLYTSDAADE